MMSQPHQPMAPVQQRAFSPPQQAPSPGPQAVGYAHAQMGVNPNKRPRVSPGPNSPLLPSHAQSPGGHSTPGAVTPNTGLPSPGLAQNQHVNLSQTQQNMYTGVYTQQPNGRLPTSTAPPSSQTASMSHSVSAVAHTPAQTPGPVPQQRMSQLSQPHLQGQYPNSHAQLAGRPQATVSTANSPTIPTPSPQQHQLPPSQSQPQSQSQQQFSHPPYVQPHFRPSPNPQSPSMAQPSATHTTASFALTPNQVGISGTMGPPTTNTPAVPPKKTFAYDMDDTLLGTGINLEEEEQIMMNHFEIRHGLESFGPGGRGSFYGAGQANQPPEQSDAKTQEELVRDAADVAWNEAARRLALARVQEMKDQFLAIPNIYTRMLSIAGSHGISLNQELRPELKSDSSGHTYMVKTTPIQESKPTVNVKVDKAPDGTMVRTSGCFLPKNAYLADQFILLSLATKQRVGSMLVDANKVAISRQRSSHGRIPPEWVDAASSESGATKEAGALGDADNLDSAVSPRTNPLKRPAKEMSNGLFTPVSGVSEASPTNPLIETIVSAGKEARNAEEARLRKRQKRLDEAAEKEKKDEGGSASRSGSIAPGTPGSVVPDSAESKAPTKKESKKQAAKMAESSSVSVNSTLNQFMGLGRKKKYSWMTGGGGGGGSGASTPRISSGTPAAGSSRSKGPLTNPGANHLGQFREDSEKGKNIQLRDWIYALEQNGTDRRTLQEAYNRLDRSDTGDKVATKAASPIVATPSTATPAAATPVPATATPVTATPVTATPVTAAPAHVMNTATNVETEGAA